MAWVIWACNTPLGNYIDVAEHTAALILAAAKNLYPVSMKLHTETPDWKGAASFPSIELAGKNLSLIGFGHIGQRVARLFSNFDMNITAYDPFIPEDAVPDYVRLVRNLDDALKDADFVSVHAAGQKSTEHLVGEHEFSMMKPTAIFINTTRGFVIDEEALIKALKEKKIAGAALDVFTKEPVTEYNELLTMDNVIATPHIAAHTPEATRRSNLAAAENLIAFFAGKRPPYALNEPKKKGPEVLPLSDTK